MSRFVDRNMLIPHSQYCYVKLLQSWGMITFSALFPDLPVGRSDQAYSWSASEAQMVRKAKRYLEQPSGCFYLKQRVGNSNKVQYKWYQDFLHLPLPQTQKQSTRESGLNNKSLSFKK